MPTSPAPTRLIVWWLSGSVRVAAVAARCRCAGRRPGAAGGLEAPGEPGPARARWPGRPGTSAQARWPITPDDAHQTLPLGAAGGAAQAGPLGRRGAVAGHARCRGAGAPRRPARVRATASRWSRARDRHLDAAPRGGGKSASTGLSQLSTGASMPSARSASASSRLVTPEPGRAVGERGPRDGGGAVAEAVGLDHRHQLAGGLRAKSSTVGRHRGQVHVQPRAGVPGGRDSASTVMPRLPRRRRPGRTERRQRR